jgi:hypothetical protein
MDDVIKKNEDVDLASQSNIIVELIDLINELQLKTLPRK